MTEQFTHEQLMVDRDYRIAYGYWRSIKSTTTQRDFDRAREVATLRLQLEVETQKRAALTEERGDLSQQRAMLRHVLGDLVAEITVWADENNTELNLVSPEERQRLREALERASSIVQHAYDDTLTHAVFVKAGYGIAGSE